MSLPDSENTAAVVPLEPVFTASEVAEYLKLDASTVRRLFADRRDVIKIAHSSSIRRGKRSYATLRVPLSALRHFLDERKR